MTTRSDLALLVEKFLSVLYADDCAICFHRRELIDSTSAAFQKDKSGLCVCMCGCTCACVYTHMCWEDVATQQTLILAWRAITEYHIVPLKHFEVMRYTGIGDNTSYLYGTLQVRKFSQVISKFTMTASG